MTRYRFATPRPGEDVLTRVPRRTGVPHRGRCGVPYRMAHRHCGADGQAIEGKPNGSKPNGGALLDSLPRRMAFPRMAHQVRPEPLPANRSRIAPDLLAIAVILAVVLAASLAGVRL